VYWGRGRGKQGSILKNLHLPSQKLSHWRSYNFLHNYHIHVCAIHIIFSDYKFISPVIHNTYTPVVCLRTDFSKFQWWDTEAIMTHKCPESERIMSFFKHISSHIPYSFSV
jgi:hypothetical protein